MNKLNLTISLIALAITFSFAQRPQGGTAPEVTITGKVIDEETKQPLEYATIAFFR